MKLINAFNQVRDYFRERRALSHAFDAASKAITQGDVPTFERAFQRHDFGDLKAKELLLSSIHHDQPEIFHKILNREFGGDVNYTVTSFDNKGPGGPVITAEEPVLNYALSHNAQNVAQSLLDSPAINLFKRGHSASTVYQLGGLFAGACHVTRCEETPSALDVARKHGMNDMAAKIIQRAAKKL
ncbi:MAG TPA: hypothetical protein VGD95_08540 [Micavibrio sp.]